MTSTQFYKKNKKSREKKKRYDKALNSRPAQIQKRVESNKKRRQAKRKGQNVKGKDYDHYSNRFVSSSVNRGRAEGGRKKGRAHNGRSL